MRKIILLSLIMIGCAHKGPSAQRNSYRFLIAGQSNSVSPAQGDFSSYFSQTGRVTLNDYYRDPTRFFVPTSTDTLNSAVSWICLGDLFVKPSRFHIVGRGGTSTRQWVDTLYVNITEALQENDYDAVLWVQGESDAGIISEEETLENMRIIISRSRAVKDIPWYVAIDGMLREPTRRAQERLIQEGYAKRGADLDRIRLEHPEYWEAGLGELERLDGHKMHARLWYEILKTEMGE